MDADADPVSHPEQTLRVHVRTGRVLVVRHVDVVPHAVVDARCGAHGPSGPCPPVPGPVPLSPAPVPGCLCVRPVVSLVSLILLSRRTAGKQLFTQIPSPNNTRHQEALLGSIIYLFTLFVCSFMFLKHEFE